MSAPSLLSAVAPVRLGFTREPVVDLLQRDAAVLYSECVTQIAIGESLVPQSGDFVGYLEERNDIGLLDVAMTDMVMDALAEDPHARLGCNISPRMLADADTWSWLVHRIGERPWLAGRLILEISESRPLGEIHDVAERFHEVQRLGCQLAIDDFGAGFSGTAHLRRVDVEWDIIKIARSCFGDMRKMPSGREGLRSLIELAGCLSRIVVVQGVETRDHLALARNAGARFGQGSMFDARSSQRWIALDDETGGRLAHAVRAHNTDFHRPLDVTGSQKVPKLASKLIDLDQALRRSLGRWGGRG